MNELAIKFLLYQLNKWKDHSNEQNNMTTELSKEQILLFPFFVCTANGNRKEMFDIFNKFYVSDLGIVEFDIENFLINNTKGASEILNECASSNYDELNVEIKKNISHSFDILKKRDINLINYPIDTLMFLSKKHSSWQILNKVINEKGLHGKKIRIPDEYMLNEMSMFAEETENRMMV
jgi:hypothetical protein